MKSFTLTVAVLLGLLSIALLGVAGPASAAEPWWHVVALSSPAAANSSDAQVLVNAANLGDASTPGTVSGDFQEAKAGRSANLVTITDVLPAGVKASAAFLGGPDNEFGDTLGGSQLYGEMEAALGRPLCVISGQVVSCTWAAPVRSYEELSVAINVQVAPGAGRGVDEVSVSGAGTNPVVSRRALALEGPAGYGAQDYELSPEEEGGAPATQAGSHPFQLTSTLMLNAETTFAHPHETSQSFFESRPVALTKDLRFNLPAGLIGNPAAIPKCPLGLFEQSLSEQLKHPCPNDTVMGVAANLLAAGIGPAAAYSPVYNLEPSAGEPAKFGFETLIGPVVLDTSVRTGGDYGVVVTVPNVPSTAPVIGTTVTFWGVPADARHNNVRNRSCLDATAPQEQGGPEPSCSPETPEAPFLIMPTSCTGPLVSNVEGDSWSDIGAFTSLGYTTQNSFEQPFGLDGCNRLNFEPAMQVAPDGQQGSTPTGLSVHIHVPQEASLNPTGLAESSVRETTVTMPAGVALNPAGADGLSACGLGEIGLQSSSEQSCPEAAKVGTLEIHTPLLPNPLVGAAYLATPAPFGEPGLNPFSSLLALYLVAKDPVSGVLVKLAGEVKADPNTGQLTATFKETPQLPFEDLTVHFFGGSRAPLSTPQACGSYAASASIGPWSGNPPAEISSPPFEISTGPNGAACASPPPFAPTLSAGSTNLQAGAFSPFVSTIGREDGNQNLDAVRLQMPPGLLGTLSSVALCGEAQANAGTCGPESLIGHTIVSVGLGPTPFTVTGGQVFITGPYEGAPFGLSIVNPAKAGPFDLGKVVVRAKIEVDPQTSALTITTDTTGPYQIPPIIDGIPLEIKHVNVSIDRPGFTFNPTSCEPLGIGSSLTSTLGASAPLSVPFQVANCATLKYSPTLSVTTAGRASRLGGASLTFRIAYPRGAMGSQSWFKTAKFDIPKQLPARLTTIQQACIAATFESNRAACPTASIIGHALVHTPVLPVPLEGPVYFVSYGGAKFPDAVLVLKGYGITIELHGHTFIDSKTSVTSATFETLPDVPFESIEVNIPQGRYSEFGANLPHESYDFCGQKLAVPTLMKAANGMQINQNTPVAVTGCPTKISISSHEVKGNTLTLTVYAPGVGKLKATGKGLSSASKNTSGIEFVTLTLKAKRRGKFRTKLHLTFAPSRGRHQSDALMLRV